MAKGKGRFYVLAANNGWASTVEADQNGFNSLSEAEDILKEMSEDGSLDEDGYYIVQVVRVAEVSGLKFSDPA